MQIMNRWMLATVAGTAALALAGCAQPMGGGYGGYPGAQPYPTAQTAPGYQNNAVLSGTVTNVQYIQGSQGPGVVGTVAGGAIGGLAGHQIGKGSGRTVATILGAVGGALVGNAIESNVTSESNRPYYQVSVQFDDGSVRTFDYAQPPQVQIGERVRAQGNQLYR